MDPPGIDTIDDLHINQSQPTNPAQPLSTTASPFCPAAGLNVLSQQGCRTYTLWLRTELLAPHQQLPPVLQLLTAALRVVQHCDFHNPRVPQPASFPTQTSCLNNVFRATTQLQWLLPRGRPFRYDCPFRALFDFGKMLIWASQAACPQFAQCFSMKPICLAQLAPIRCWPNRLEGGGTAFGEYSPCQGSGRSILFLPVYVVLSIC